MKHRRYGGIIRHIHDNGNEVGREWFTISVHRDQRTVRALCELEGEEIVRDTTYTVDGDWRPLDCFVRLSVNDAFQGSGWFLFTDHAIECETFTADAGRVSQTVSVARRPPVFVPHPLVCDGWQTAALSDVKPGQVQHIHGAADSSPLPHGGSGPMIGLTDKAFRYEGEETITVPAGTFQTRHYDLLPSNTDWPPLGLWVAGEDRQLIKARWDLRERDYVLTELWGDMV